MVKKAGTENKSRSAAAKDAGSVNDEKVVYVDKDGNQLESGEAATNGGRILRGEDAEKYLTGEALPQFGITAVDGDDDADADTTFTASDKGTGYGKGGDA